MPGRGLRLVLCLAVVAGPKHLAAQSVLTTTLENHVRDQYRALAAADTATLKRILADELVWVVGPTGAAVGKAAILAAASRPQNPPPRFTVDSLRVRRAGTAAVVDYLRGDTRQLGDSQLVTTSRVVEVFVERDRRWQLAAHSQTWHVSPVSPIQADSASLSRFVGHYRIAPGYVDDVHWDGGHLVATAAGQPAGAVLVPVSATAFSPDGVGALIVFERDQAGRVTGYVQALPNGQVIRAARLP